MRNASICHVRSAHDFLGAPSLLVSYKRLSSLPAYARHAVPGGYAVPLEWRDELDDLLLVQPRCENCANDRPCPHWDWALLASHGVTPRAQNDISERAEPPAAAPDQDVIDQATELLDLTDAEARDPELVRAGYKRAALLHHPDRGGDAATMARVTAARDTLLRLIR